MHGLLGLCGAPESWVLVCMAGEGAGSARDLGPRRPGLLCGEEGSGAFGKGRQRDSEAELPFEDHPSLSELWCFSCSGITDIVLLQCDACDSRRMESYGDLVLGRGEEHRRSAQ